MATHMIHSLWQAQGLHDLSPWTCPSLVYGPCEPRALLPQVPCHFPLTPVLSPLCTCAHVDPLSWNASAWYSHLSESFLCFKPQLKASWSFPPQLEVKTPFFTSCFYFYLSVILLLRILEFFVFYGLSPLSRPRVS